jgi:S-adenosylmethionine:tRNA ribosyltransferase-isomerase
VRVERFDYELPESSIAQAPLPERDGARLLVLDARGRSDRTVRDLPSLVPPRALVVLNDTRVIPARLLGKKAATGGRVEVFLLRREAAGDEVERWIALGKSSKGFAPGMEIELAEGLRATVLSVREAGVIEVELEVPSGATVHAAIEREGHVPLPPYITRSDAPADRERYQTVFARTPGAVAAPTAGLHLSDALLDALRAAGATTATVTLHVGLGTFRPVTADDLDDHPMHAEWLSIPEETAAAVRAARAEGRPVMAVGTTVVRALETAAAHGDGEVVAFEGDTSLLIQPGYRFRAVDALLTNFHLPKSTLLALVAAFGGLERVLEAYAHAVAAGYRFFSYGDAMLLTSRVAEAEAAR